MKVGGAIELLFDLLNSEFWWSRLGWHRGPALIHEWKLVMKLVTLLLLNEPLTGLEKIILQLTDR